MFGVYDGEYGALERVADHVAAPPPFSRGSGSGKSWPARVLAAGAIERPMVFGGNDRPGVMLASARSVPMSIASRRARTARRGLHDQRRWLAYRGDLARAGIEVVAVIDPRTERCRRGSCAATGCSIHLGAA